MQNNKTKQQIGRKKKQTNILMGWTNNFSRNYTNGYLEHLYTYSTGTIIQTEAVETIVIQI